MASRKKPAVHKEWFRKSCKSKCPCRTERRRPGEVPDDVYTWGQYRHGRWNTIIHFCQRCFVGMVQSSLIGHAAGCGCSFELVGYQGLKLPDWLKMPDTCTREAA